jgi:hypothetical protein
MDDPQYAPFIKKCQALVNVRKDVIFFPVVVNLVILSTFEAFYLTLSAQQLAFEEVKMKSDTHTCLSPAGTSCTLM